MFYSLIGIHFVLKRDESIIVTRTKFTVFLLQNYFSSTSFNTVTRQKRIRLDLPSITKMYRYLNDWAKDLKTFSQVSSCRSFGNFSHEHNSPFFDFSASFLVIVSLLLFSSLSVSCKPTVKAMFVFILNSSTGSASSFRRGSSPISVSTPRRR